MIHRNESMPLPLNNFENMNYHEMDDETKKVQNDRVLKMLEDSLKSYDPVLPENVVVLQQDLTGSHTLQNEENGLSKIEEINSFVEDDTKLQYTNGPVLDNNPQMVEMASAQEMY